MIFDAMKLIQAALQQYILQVEESTSASQETVILDNISMAEELGGTGSNQDERVVMSLVNLQEEVTLKNEPFHRVENGRTVYQNPPIQLNLFILFSVLHSKEYEASLKRLSRVIEFFQWKKELSFTATPPAINIPQEVKLLPDLYSLTFEQLNYLWGSLGGKQVPFVLYRFRLVAIEAEKRLAEGTPITEIGVNSNGAI
ncbi:DUF4255 domain-containing protein [Cyanobacteria bacterium FACHB-63]|nr:DUF4255 domain-containing protein [Cyanobacteria bacterium FACHB-63]